MYINIFFYFNSYKLRIESMLLKEEFSTNVSYLDPCINALIYASEGKHILQDNIKVGF